jgi:hypothetical protein
MKKVHSDLTRKINFGCPGTLSAEKPSSGPPNKVTLSKHPKRAKRTSLRYLVDAFASV